MIKENKLIIFNLSFPSLDISVKKISKKKCPILHFNPEDNFL